MNGQLQGWINLNKFGSQSIPQKTKPNGVCKFCGIPIYWIKIILKNGFKWVAFEDGNHGGNGMKVVYNHRNISQTRKSCLYDKKKK